MEILGFAAALLIGISLGLIGGGGSILTVPVLVYMLDVNPVLSTAYSLFIVGTTAIVGAVNHARKGLIDLRIGVLFAIPSIAAVYLTRLLIVPRIPETLWSSGFTLTKDTGIMLFFAIIMVLAAFSMIRKKETIEEGGTKKSIPVLKVILEGLVVGFLTGLVGAGGGFLIIPVLVLWAGLPMKTAVGTSLMIIALKSLIGFLGDIQSGQQIDWSVLLTFTAISVIGIFAGGYIANWISGRKLQQGFGWFVLMMSIYIVIAEII